MRSLFPPAGKAKQTIFGPLTVPVAGPILGQGGCVVSPYPAPWASDPSPGVGYAQICCDCRQLESRRNGSLGLVGDLVTILVPTRGVRVVVSMLQFVV
jgi:hypothetical protein